MMQGQYIITIHTTHPSHHSDSDSDTYKSVVTSKVKYILHEKIYGVKNEVHA